ncbi:MAG: methanogenesis marker protein Mmp4/MtxX [Methanoregulaceae archaeon]|jgi:putative methanogen marker protein 4|nr:methanogenesis marker protein Mmp4/MtxX [Methanoregulaceae archaeon]
MKKIGIGIEEETEKVISSVVNSGISDQVILYCKPGTIGQVGEKLNIHLSACPEQDMVTDLMNCSIRAAIRGTLPANATLSALKKAAGVDHLERIALLETAGGKKFLLAPVGVDEGWSVAEKVTFVKKGREIAERFGLPKKVAILSGGRLGDIGRSRRVDRSMAEAELVARLTGETHYEILVETAISEAGVIIAPDGIAGNLMFRTLIFLGAGHGHGAPVVNIDRIFVDTSRASPDYRNAIMLADSLSKP